MSIREIVRNVWDFLGKNNHRAHYYRGIAPVKVQLVFNTDSDATEARRLFEMSEEGRTLLTLENPHRSVHGYVVDGMEVEFLGPDIRVYR